MGAACHLPTVHELRLQHLLELAPDEGLALSIANGGQHAQDFCAEHRSAGP